MLIVVESSELRLVPLIFSAPKITEPVPLGSRLISSLDLVPSILLSLILIAGNKTDPEPAGVNTISSFDLTALMLLPVIESASVVIPGAE